MSLIGQPTPQQLIDEAETTALLARLLPSETDRRILDDYAQDLRERAERLQAEMARRSLQ